MALLQKGYH